MVKCHGNGGKCDFQSKSARLILKHFSSVHNVQYLTDGCIRCFYDGCAQNFTQYRGLRRHLKNCSFRIFTPNRPVANEAHAADANEVEEVAREQIRNRLFPNNGAQVDLRDQVHNQSFQNGSEENVEAHAVHIDDGIQKQLTESIDHFISQVLGLGIASSSIDLMIRGVQSINDIALDNLKLTIQTSSDLNKNSDCLLRTIQTLSNGYDHLRSKYLRNKNLSSLPQPKELFLCYRKDNRFDKASQSYKEVSVPCNFQYISILETLQVLINQEHFLYHVMNSKLGSSDDSIISDVTDGKIFKENPLTRANKNVLLIQPFFDEVELCNPAGNKTGSYKIGALYFVIRNIGPFHNSKLNNIYLLALFHSADIDEVGFDPVLEPFVKEMKILETKGITSALDANITFKACLVTMSYDNLGANAISGMVANFRTPFFCRFCYGDDIFGCVREDQLTLRTNESNKMHLNEALTKGLVHSHGVKKACLLNSLNYFKFPENHSVDTMHDVLEGTLVYEVKLLLTSIVYDHNVINMESLNARIRNFNYGYIERKNRPSPVNLEKQSKTSIGQRAGQMYCLGRYLPLILGDLIVNEDLLKKWSLHILLLRIIQIIFSPKISKGMVSQLSVLVDDFLCLFKTLYPNETVLPKMHFLIHHARVILNLGPLTQLSAIRFEAHHLYFKNLARTLKNFINICKTLATRYQQAKQTVVLQNTYSIELSHGIGTYQSLSKLEFGARVADFLDVSIDERILLVKSLTYIHNYREKFLICFKLDDRTDLPLFGFIHKLFIFDNAPLALIYEYHCMEFDEHYFCYKVRPTQISHIIDLRVSLSPYPYELHTNLDAEDDSLFIVPKIVIF